MKPKHLKEPQDPEHLNKLQDLEESMKPEERQESMQLKNIVKNWSRPSLTLTHHHPHTHTRIYIICFFFNGFIFLSKTNKYKLQFHFYKFEVVSI
jgi:hypothetical protein